MQIELPCNFTMTIKRSLKSLDIKNKISVNQKVVFLRIRFNDFISSFFAVKIPSILKVKMDEFLNHL